jgi:hypothetical protein
VAVGLWDNETLSQRVAVGLWDNETLSPWVAVAQLSSGAMGQSGCWAGQQ